LFDFIIAKANQIKIKRCNHPNPLTDKEKAIIADGF